MNMSGYSFGTSAAATPLNLSASASAATTQSTLASKRPIGLTLGTPASTNTGGSFKIPATNQLGNQAPVFGSSQTAGASTVGSAFNLSTAATGTSTLGGGLGGFSAPTSSGTLTLGGLGGTTTSTSSTGFGLGTFGSQASTGLGAPVPGQSSTGLTLGGGIGTGLAGFASSSTAGTVSSSLFSTSVAQAPKGLGGVDPKTSLGSGSTQGSKLGDSKAIRETNIPNEIGVTVEDYKKYVKNQKSVRENIARMSSKPMYKVQEEAASLRQLLASVTNSLQRNAVAIQKLKAHSAKELKHVEIAQRTKETPPGLQYEHTAPTAYFQSLGEEFEGRMSKYRQQIEEMENHLASLNVATMLTPQELSMLLAKVHSSMLSLAAQLYAVHEEVKVQREHYLNYRRVFQGDTSDVFEKRRKAEQARSSAISTHTLGPKPFGDIPSAMAMASALKRT